MIEITISWCGQLESSEADIVKRLVVYAIWLIRVLHQLMHWESAVVRLDHGVWYLRKEARINADVQRMASYDIERARISHKRIYTNERVQALYAGNARGIVLLRTKGRFLAGALSRIHCTLSCAHQKVFCVTPQQNTSRGWFPIHVEIRNVTLDVRPDLVLFPKINGDFIREYKVRN